MENHSISDTRAAISKDVENLKRDAAQIAQDVKEHASAHVGQAKQRVSDHFVAVRDNLTEHPLALLGVGFVLGLLFGFRLRR